MTLSRRTDFCVSDSLHAFAAFGRCNQSTPAVIRLQHTVVTSEVNYVRRCPLPIPIDAIDLETLEGEILHTGSLILTRGATQLALQNVTIDSTNGILTGVISLNGDIVDGTRFLLFDIDLVDADLTRFPKWFIRVLAVDLAD